MSENFSEMTARELKEYAEINGIDLGETKTKTGIIAILSGAESQIGEAVETAEIEEAQEVTAIVSVIPERVGPPQSNMGSKNDDSVVASKAASRPKPVAKEEKKDALDKVAVWSPKSIIWENVGRLTPGYNIVSKRLPKSGLLARVLELQPLKRWLPITESNNGDC